jgi:hypothetical protein
MSTIYFVICILFICSIISALPTPAIVYSGVIHNTQNSRIQCNIFWSTPANNSLLRDLITVEQNNYYVIKEKLIDMGSWTARGIIKGIRCGHLMLRAPFPNVRTIEINWEFRVEPNRIVSVGPSSYVSDNIN